MISRYFIVLLLLSIKGRTEIQIPIYELAKFGLVKVRETEFSYELTCVKGSNLNMSKTAYKRSPK